MPAFNKRLRRRKLFSVVIQEVITNKMASPGRVADRPLSARHLPFIIPSGSAQLVIPDPSPVPLERQGRAEDMRARNGLMGRGEVSEVIGVLPSRRLLDLRSRGRPAGVFRRDRGPAPPRGLRRVSLAAAAEELVCLTPSRRSPGRKQCLPISPATPIANSRLITIDERGVTFRYKNEPARAGGSTRRGRRISARLTRGAA